ncbi:MAG TPA: gamma-glutamyltransferase [Thermoguttaceae bacterium]|nr:gamma-glutamyltransferase [Thermoguttaceae bacterium]
MIRNNPHRAMILVGVVLPALCVACGNEHAWAGGTVATVHPLGTDAGIETLEQGGNAIDAAVAAALTLGVVDGRNAGIGGGCFILIRLADGKLVAIDGREIAPAAATRDMYLRDGKPDPELSLTGPLASGVPGALAAYDRAVREYGKRDLRDLLLPAAEIAERGFPIQRAYAGAIKHLAEKLARFEGSRAVLLKPDGSPYLSGEVLKQPDLARTYRAIADEGIDWFYRGPLAREVGRWMAEHGGIITAEDFAGYRARVREPVVTTYRGYTIVGFPPPSSGGVHVAQILNILERFDLKGLYERQPATFYHVVAEAMKRAFADRAHWLGDPDFADVPRGLVDREYGAELSTRIVLDRVTPVATHGEPPRWQQDHFGKHTTHIAAVDSEGNWVAITATVNGGFGSKVIVPGTGVILNNQMDDFSAAPGAPNAAGLLGAEANAIAPGKRPLSSMSPTVVLKDGKPILTLGAAGGPKIITQVLMTILYHLDLGMDLPEALAAPRIHHQWQPDELVVEQSLDPAIVAALEKLGHKVKRTRSVGVTQAIGVSSEAGGLIGVHDPRVEGKAAGF